MKWQPRAPREGINVSPTHPLKEALVLVTAVTLGAAVIFVVTMTAIDAAVTLVPPKVEARAFAAVWPQVRGMMGEEEHVQATRLQQIVDRLAAHWQDNPYTFRVGIRDDPAANAFAVPGGLILVTRGMLDGARSENEVAAILGHEIGHFYHRDHLRGLGRTAAVALLFATIGVTGAGASVPELVETIGNSTKRGFDRDQERAADRFGLALVHDEYGHVAGATAFFERMADEEGGARKLTAFLSTHPGSASRARDLEALAAERGWNTAGELLPLWPAEVE